MVAGTEFELAAHASQTIVEIEFKLRILTKNLLLLDQGGGGGGGRQGLRIKNVNMGVH